MMPWYGRDALWILQGHGFYTKGEILDTIRHDKSPILMYPCIIDYNIKFVGSSHVEWSRKVPLAPRSWANSVFRSKFWRFRKENQRNIFFLLISFQIYKRCGIFRDWNRGDKCLTVGGTSPIILYIRQRKEIQRKKQKNKNINRLNFQPFTTPPSELLHI